MSCKTWKPACGPPHGFSPNLCRLWLDGAMKVYRAVCYQCQYPRCTVCKSRPDFPPPHNSRGGKRNFMCEKCRWPPCAGCGVVPRPVSTKYNVDNMKEWYCKTCSERSCLDCGTVIKALENGKHILREHEKNPDQRLLCTTCKYPRCVVCKKGERPHHDLEYSVDVKPRFVCPACRSQWESVQRLTKHYEEAHGASAGAALARGGHPRPGRDGTGRGPIGSVSAARQ